MREDFQLEAAIVYPCPERPSEPERERYAWMGATAIVFLLVAAYAQAVWALVSQL